MSRNMFSALENAWDQSPRRRWTTLASFTLQAFGLSLLLAIPLLTIQGPPRLQWLDSPILTRPPAPAPPPTGQHPTHSSNLSGEHLLSITTIPPRIADLHEPQVGSAPDLDSIGVPGGIGTAGRGISGGIGNPAVDVAPPPAPVPAHPLKISHWAEGNVIYRVQPVYPTLARQARVQGAVELRAIISKAGIHRKSDRRPRTSDARDGRHRSGPAMALSPLPAEQRAHRSGDRNHGKLRVIGWLTPVVEWPSSNGRRMSLVTIGTRATDSTTRAVTIIAR